jgi:hypothetical protein
MIQQAKRKGVAEGRSLTAGQPHCEMMTPGARHWSIFKRVCVDAGARGPIIADAWFAALAIERACVWITCDRDYARFVEWRTPGP